MSTVMHRRHRRGDPRLADRPWRVGAPFSCGASRWRRPPSGRPGAFSLQAEAADVHPTSPVARWATFAVVDDKKNYPPPLKPKWAFLLFWLPQPAARAPSGPGETGAGGVRSLLVPILLNGGFGYENL